MLLDINYMVNNKAVNDTLMLPREYFENAFGINDPDKLYLLRDKNELYRRCPDLLKRECLDVTTTSPAEVEDFMKRHKRFVGKVNLSSYSQAFCIYDTSKMTATQILKNMKRLNQTLLEEYIVQHETIMAIYPDSVNTIRIHTVNNGSEIRMFLKPMFRSGCDGSVVDALAFTSCYRALVEADGSLSHTSYIDKWSRGKAADRHHNTSTRFNTIRLPYISEMLLMAKTAAARFPELTYIGWDVAITQQGPVIVEGNGISGAIDTYQQVVYIYDKHGIKQQLTEMFEYGRGKTRA